MQFLFFLCFLDCYLLGLFHILLQVLGGLPHAGQVVGLLHRGLLGLLEALLHVIGGGLDSVHGRVPGGHHTIPGVPDDALAGVAVAAVAQLEQPGRAGAAAAGRL